MARNTSVSLGDHFESFVDEQVASGRYGTVSEVVRDALRMLEDDERKLAWLREQIAVADEPIRNGHVHEVNETFWDELNRDVDERPKRGDRPPHMSARRLRVVSIEHNVSRKERKRGSTTWHESHRFPWSLLCMLMAQWRSIFVMDTPHTTPRALPYRSLRRGVGPSRHLSHARA